MKKRVLSLLMAFCLMLTLAPAALAVDNQPDTITLPNGEVREIPTLNVEDTPMALSNDDVVITYTIDDIDDFNEITAEEWHAGYRFEITGNLNLSLATTQPAEWGGYIPYFNGTIVGVADPVTGELPVISGIPDNCAFIYGIIGGTIENLVFKHEVQRTESGVVTDGSAYFITFMPVNSNLASILTMRNVTTIGEIVLNGTDQSNYSPFVYCASTKGIRMENCTNEASMTGTIYGSVFHGYYPLFYNATSPIPYQFVGCENNAPVTFQYAGMFFGNTSTIETKLANGSISLQIEGCKNSKEIRGTTRAEFLAAPVGNFGTQMNLVEGILDGTGTATASYPNVKAVEGLIPSKGEPLTGLGISISTEEGTDGYTLVINRPNNEDNVSYYVVNVSAYVNLWYPTHGENGEFFGTNRVTVSQRINVDTMGTGTTYTPSIKAYNFADAYFGNSGSAIVIDSVSYPTRTQDNVTYYAVNEVYSVELYQYISTELGTDGWPVGNGSKAADIITVSAYNGSGELLGTAIL